MREDFGPLLYAGSRDVLAGAKQERVKRLVAMAGKVPATAQAAIEWRARAEAVCGLFDAAPAGAKAQGEGFATEWAASTAGAQSYIDAVRSLPREVAGRGVHWLQQIVDALMAEAAALLPSLEL